VIGDDGSIDITTLESIGYSNAAAQQINTLSKTMFEAASSDTLLTASKQRSVNYYEAIKNGEDISETLNAFSAQTTKAATGALVAFDNLVIAGSEMTVKAKGVINDKLSAYDPNGGTLKFAKYAGSAPLDTEGRASVSPNGEYTYNTPPANGALITPNPGFKFNVTSTSDKGVVVSDDAKIQFLVYPYFRMSNISVNDGPGFTLRQFRSNGIETNGERYIKSVSFDLLAKGSPISANGTKDVLVAMDLIKGKEKLTVALSQVRFTDLGNGNMQVTYLKDAKMYGYYSDGTQSVTTVSINTIQDVLKTEIDLNGNTKFSFKMEGLANSFNGSDQDLVRNSPLLAKTASGDYTATFAMQGISGPVKVGGADDPVDGGFITFTRTVAVPQLTSGTPFTVTGSGVIGKIHFPAAQ
jgi:hypothetical protein